MACRSFSGSVRCGHSGADIATMSVYDQALAQYAALIDVGPRVDQEHDYRHA
jgi:hypothetical protein